MTIDTTPREQQPATWCLGWQRPPHVTTDVRTSRDGLPLCPDCRRAADRLDLTT